MPANNHANTQSDIYSFLKAGDIWAPYERAGEFDQFVSFIWSTVSKHPSEKPIGVYMNALDSLDFLVVTDMGLHRVSGSHETFLAYDTIQSVGVPVAETQNLSIKVKSGESIELPVRGTTEGLSDVFAMYQFLTCLFGPDLEPQLKLKDIEDICDLKAFLRQNLCGVENPEDISQWLSKDLKRWIRKADIDPDILQQRGIWRLLALAFTLTERKSRSERN